MEHSWMMTLYNELIVDAGDPRTKGWMLIDTPIAPFFIVLAYVCFVIMIGPTFMKGRKPFNLKYMILCYDVLQVVFCLLFLFQVGILMPLNENLFCMEVVTDDDKRNKTQAYLGWFYYMMKYLDLMDTIFFVFTKKFQHISFLHLFHHTTMIGASWFCVKFVPSGAVAVIVYVNTWVHAIMYTYYFGSLYYGKIDVIFKKLMTLIQLGQFTITAGIWLMQLINPSCSFSKIMLVGMIAHASSFIYLFTMFYYNTYIKPKKVVSKVTSLKSS